MRVRAPNTHECRKHWCVLHGFNLPVIMILLGVSKRAAAEAMGRSFDGHSYTTKCLKGQSCRDLFEAIQRGLQTI